MRALIGRNPCLDQAIQTRKTIVLLFIKQLLYGFRVWLAWSKHAGMLRELRKAREITSLWIRPTKHGNHKVIVYS
jgi:hypothetical protein